MSCNRWRHMIEAVTSCLLDWKCCNKKKKPFPNAFFFGNGNILNYVMCKTQTVLESVSFKTKREKDTSLHFLQFDISQVSPPYVFIPRM